MTVCPHNPKIYLKITYVPYTLWQLNTKAYKHKHKFGKGLKIVGKALRYYIDL